MEQCIFCEKQKDEGLLVYLSDGKPAFYHPSCAQSYMTIDGEPKKRKIANWLYWQLAKEVKLSGRKFLMLKTLIEMGLDTSNPVGSPRDVIRAIARLTNLMPGDDPEGFCVSDGKGGYQKVEI